MINFIKGKLYDIIDDTAIIECSGVGYEIHCPLSDITELSSKKDQEILLYTHFIHKEDSMNLYGFVNIKTKNGFIALLKVGGIGPKAALRILSHFDVASLFQSVEKGDVETLNSIPGIGPKTAKKIIFDLKGIIIETEGASSKLFSAYENDLISAMMNLGYKENDIKNKLKDLKPLSDDFQIDFRKLLRKIAGK